MVFVAGQKASRQLQSNVQRFPKGISASNMELPQVSELSSGLLQNRPCRNRGNTSVPAATVEHRCAGLDWMTHQ